MDFPQPLRQQQQTPSANSNKRNLVLANETFLSLPLSSMPHLTPLLLLQLSKCHQSQANTAVDIVVVTV
jgi:hypothetical protein